MSRRLNKQAPGRWAGKTGSLKGPVRRRNEEGCLTSRRDGRTKIYRPKVAAKRVLRDAVSDVVHRLFDGEVLAMMNHLVQDHGMSQKDISQLRKMLDDAEGKSK